MSDKLCSKFYNIWIEVRVTELQFVDLLFSHLVALHI